MGTLELERRDAVTSLACQYAGGVIAALPSVEGEQELYEGLAGAFLAFLEEVENLCPTIGTPAS